MGNVHPSGETTNPIMHSVTMPVIVNVPMPCSFGTGEGPNVSYPCILVMVGAIYYQHSITLLAQQD